MVRASRMVRPVLWAVMCTVVLAACGEGSGGQGEGNVPPETSSTATSAPGGETTTTVTASEGSSCVDLAARALQLARDARATMRGVRAPTPEEEAELEARRQALLAEANELGCPVPPGLS